MQPCLISTLPVVTCQICHTNVTTSCTSRDTCRRRACPPPHFANAAHNNPAILPRKATLATPDIHFTQYKSVDSTWEEARADRGCRFAEEGYDDDMHAARMTGLCIHRRVFLNAVVHPAYRDACIASFLHSPSSQF
jgi:hypothetical protein